MKKKRKTIFILGIIILVGVAAILILAKLPSTGQATANQGGTNQGGVTQQVQIVPLSQEERQKVIQTISSSDFFQDIPEKNPIALTFFSFEEGKRIWRDGYLLSKGQFLTSGEATIYLQLHSKYVSELDGSNLCEVIQRANKNGDLGFESEYGSASLLVKYASMLKYRDCFGF